LSKLTTGDNLRIPIYVIFIYMFFYGDLTGYLYNKQL